MTTSNRPTHTFVRKAYGRIAARSLELSSTGEAGAEKGGGCCGPQSSSCCGGDIVMGAGHSDAELATLTEEADLDHASPAPGTEPARKPGATPRLQVFDPAMCCSTGVCGPAVDPKLVRFSADLDWLKARGVAVERFNLAQQPMAFAQDAEVRAALQDKGEGALPLIKVDGKVQSLAVYPSRDQLAAWAGVNAPAASIYTEAVQELVALGAAIASNCEPCFKFHYDRARKLGVSKEDMLRAVKTAQAVKETPAKAVLGLAERYLRPATELLATPEARLLSAAPAADCCGGISEADRCCG